MNTVIILIVIGLAIMVVISLIRGLIAFMQMTKEDLESPGITRSHQMQNKMMFSRVKYQAMAVVAIAVLLMFNQ